MAASDYPQSLIDQLGRTPEDQLDASVSRRFVGRGPMNRMTYREMYGVTALCWHRAIASGFIMQILEMIEEDLVLFEGLTRDQVREVKIEIDLESVLEEHRAAQDARAPAR